MNKTHFQYLKLNKPYGVLSQFTKENPEDRTLADLVDIDKSIYPIGRLDKETEGLLLLTNDMRMKTKILSPKSQIQKTYVAQVEGIFHEKALSLLQRGVEITVGKLKYMTRPAEIITLEMPPHIPERIPPIRFRKAIPTSWIKLTIHEGKNRQVRKMCAAAGFPVLRLIRVSVGKILIGNLYPGEMRSLTPEEISNL